MSHYDLKTLQKLTTQNLPLQFEDSLKVDHTRTKQYTTLKVPFTVWRLFKSVLHNLKSIWKLTIEEQIMALLVEVGLKGQHASLLIKAPHDII